ncbi:MAG TPA: GYF domain-containing protein, partial [Polyangiales bacterium]|nr:GYF domain-containing protein [Polyangiales bacterium]
MKFLCGNCKAKYQIADEKVTGRTLRMKCRRCGHDILIDGHATPQSSPPPAPAPAPRRTSGSTVSVVPGPRAGSSSTQLPTRPGTSAALPRPGGGRSKPPSGLSAEFRRHVAAPPEVPQRTAPYDLWHVAIQDVPVGPMTRDELGRKIDAGAVTPESLCWREGMDDWRPVGELAELASLLRRNRDASRPMRGRPPPNVPGPGATGSRSAPLPVPAAPAPAPEEYEEDNAEPTRISEFTPSMALALPSQTAPQH